MTQPQRGLGCKGKIGRGSPFGLPFLSARSKGLVWGRSTYEEPFWPPLPLDEVTGGIVDLVEGEGSPEWFPQFRPPPPLFFNRDKGRSRSREPYDLPSLLTRSPEALETPLTSSGWRGGQKGSPRPVFPSYILILIGRTWSFLFQFFSIKNVEI
ncbi:hypothetical protein CRG98_031187 [Punica granatum]|uniref:Uncharacterized protein n=1 Tax=Punica granatum TaxID=22663 RepID=A0A2I0IWX6_PUNGR|nr:hypothetical protein CRG98_031187 [Punica granatum]